MDIQDYFGEQNDIIFHDQFREIWYRAFADKESSLWKKDTLKVEYAEGKKVLLYDDLKAVIEKMNDHPQNALACRKDFEDFINTMTVLDMSYAPGKYVWYNSTRNGINLRPGKTISSGKLPPAVRMGGQTAHAIVGGRTGSGKSVFLNNLILNMITEYSPWELELYLADFKKVEMSQYMNKYPTPHVRACAATSEIEYVLTLIRYIKERKDDRETLFSRLQVNDIESFREEYGTKREKKQLPEVVMPRILFLVDEFQQLFLDASAKQKDEIDDLITDITRKGRATGVHLLFASQDMSGALSEKQMSNFRMRFALSCEGSVSSQILGNNGAVGLKLGQVICNTTSKNLEDNQLYQVPNVKNKMEQLDNGEESDSYLYSVLKEVMSYSETMNYHYRLNQKYYNEDQQWDIEELKKILSIPSIIKARDSISSVYFTSMLFGKYVIHTNRRYDIVNFHLERGKNRNILCVSGNNEDLAYMMKLLAINFGTLKEAHKFTHRYIDLNPVVSMMYDPKMFKRDLGMEIDSDQDQNMYCTSIEDFDLFIHSVYENRKAIIGVLQNTDKCRTSFDYFRMLMEYRLPDLDESSILEAIEPHKDSILAQTEAIISALKDESYNNTTLDNVEDDYYLKYWCRYKIKKVPSNLLFPPVVFWFNGIENIENLPRWFENFVSNCLDVNILCIFFASSTVQYPIATSSNYNFVSGTDNTLYERYYDERIHVGMKNIKIYCHIKNRNQKVAFKKYKAVFNEIESNSFELDSLIPDGLF